jgi:hypothetical protein
MHNFFKFTKNKTLESIINEDLIDNEIDYEKFILTVKNDPNLTNGLDTYYNTNECKKLLKEIHGEEYENESLPELFFIDYIWTQNLERNFGYLIYNSLTKSPFILTFGQEDFNTFKLLLNIAKKVDMNLFYENKKIIIDDSFLEALRIKEENRGIKLTKEQGHVVESIEDQCRWWYIPADDVTEILNVLGIKPSINEGDIMSILDDVQRENKVAIATFTGHTIIFGFNAPYTVYPDLQTYLAKEEQQTLHLQDILNKLSKAFGIAAYFEYNNEDEQIASLAWSSKGKFVYGRFTSEGEGYDVFGTQKKTMDVNHKSIIKMAKKLGMSPVEILTGIMKQKMPIQYFEQPHWYIESMLERYKN